MQGLINHQLDLSIIILWVGLAFLTACTTLMFHHFLKPGMIFNPYANLLESFKSNYKRWNRINKVINHIVKFRDKHKLEYKIYWYRLFINKIVIYITIGFNGLFAYLSKPLGLCPYCNGTWIGIVVYIYFFGLNLPIVLFLGINYFFINLIYKNNEKKD